ncbi:MAG TPA: hypothetical protein PKW95_16690 [bacterium]|nr:hypothetical protein [bacterium]
MIYSRLETKSSIEPPSALSMRLWLMLMIFNAVALGVNLAFSVRVADGNTCYYGAWGDFLKFGYSHFFVTLILLGATFFAATWLMFRVIRRDGRRVKLTLALLPLSFIILLVGLGAAGGAYMC